eukprot:768229-Hanusia_phi.AAC.1
MRVAMTDMSDRSGVRGVSAALKDNVWMSSGPAPQFTPYHRYDPIGTHEPVALTKKTHPFTDQIVLGFVGTGDQANLRRLLCRGFNYKSYRPGSSPPFIRVTTPANI